MADDTKIQWTDATWNPIRGCRRVSEGCRNCYAERDAARFSGPGQPYEGLVKQTAQGPRWTGGVRVVDSLFAQPLRWRRPRRVFVNSMSDLFYENFSFYLVAALWGVMIGASQHIFQVLTKRPERALAFFGWLKEEGARQGKTPLEVCLYRAEVELGVYPGDVLYERLNAARAGAWPAPNIHLGVSVEDQATATERVPALLRCPAAVRWVSAEPLLGRLELWALRAGDQFDGEGAPYLNALGGATWWPDGRHGLSLPTSIDWVVVGGESGPNARPCELGWVEDVVQQCRESRRPTPVFVKQLGARPVRDGGLVLYRDRKGGDPSEWPPALRVRQEVGP